MEKPHLKTRFFKTNTAESLLSYNKQNNFCDKLYNKERKNYHISLKLSKVTDNKTFWKSIKLFSSVKGTNKNKVTLIDKNKVNSDDEQLCKTFSNCFSRDSEEVLEAFFICLVILIVIW